MLRELNITPWTASSILTACRQPPHPAQPGLTLLTPMNCSLQLCRQETELMLQTFHQDSEKFSVYGVEFLCRVLAKDTASLLRLVSVTGWVFYKTQDRIHIPALTTSLEISGAYNGQGFAVSSPCSTSTGYLPSLGKIFTWCKSAQLQRSSGSCAI